MNVMNDIHEASVNKVFFQVLSRIQLLTKRIASFIKVLLPLDDCGVRGKVAVLRLEPHVELLDLEPAAGFQVGEGLGAEAVPVRDAADHVALVDEVDRFV